MNIAVYCGSSDGSRAIYRSAAKQLGEWIAAAGHTLIYGGGDEGLMGAVAEAAYRGGSRVIGVVPANIPFICSRPQPWCTQVLRMEDMQQRKAKMLALADAFIALPGGIGTLDEISEAITMTRIGAFRKPCVLYNTDGIYDPLRELFQRMVDAGFVAPDSLGLVRFSADPDEIAGWLNSVMNE